MKTPSFFLLTLFLGCFMPFANAQVKFTELLCVGGFSNESVKKEFQLTIEPSSGFMWGFTVEHAIGFFNIDDRSKPFSKDFKCQKTESAYSCTGGNSIGFSHAELSRYTGAMLITTALKNDLLNASFKCQAPPKKKF